MTRARLGRVALAGALMAASVVASVRGANADDVVPVQFDYEPRVGCPSSDAFVREVLARAPRARLATTADQPRSLVVRIRSSARGLDGTLVVREADGHATERTVHAQDCDELVTALAVIAAIVIDPLSARGGRIDDLEAGAADAADAAPALAIATDAAVKEHDEAWLAPKEEPYDSGAATHPWLVSAGGGGGIVGGVSPVVLLSVPLFVEVSRVVTDVFEPTVRLRFERTSIGAVTEETGGGASFALTSGAVDLCPVAFRGGSVRLQPCLRAEVGALSVQGRDVDPIRSDVRPWFAVGLLGRARLEIAKPIFAELEGALLAAAVRDRFFVEPATAIYRPPALGATAAFAIGVTFW